MTRTAQVVFFLAIVLVGTAALGQIPRCPSPTIVASVDSTRATFTDTVKTYPNPAVTYYMTVTNVLSHASNTVTSQSPTTTVSGLDPNTPYTVTATASTSACTTSVPSAPVAATTAPAPPTSISGLGGLNKVTVSWVNSPGAASYTLTLSNGMSFTVPGGAVALSNGQVGTSYTVTGLQTATSYNVIVAGISASGARGTFSPVVAVRTANVALQ